MKKLVIYDSVYQNTAKVAEAMGDAVKVSEISRLDLEGVDLLVVGTPTMGGRAKPELQVFIDKIEDGSLKGVCVAAFDTRLVEEKQVFWLRVLMKKIGYAAPKVLSFLVKKGGKGVGVPEGFFVEGKRGPLVKGELERAKKWVIKLQKEIA